MTDRNPTPPGARKTLSPVPVWGWVLIGAVALAIVGAGVWMLTGSLANVPDVVGRSADEATLALESAGFTTGAVTTVETSAPTGRVLAQSPAPGTLGRRGDAVRLTVAAPIQVGVPTVVGLTGFGARSTASATGLQIATLESYDASATSGTVLAQAPPAGGKVVRGSVIAVIVSKGPAPAPVPVPDVKGRMEIDASAILTLAGFRPVMHDGSASAVETGSVIGQLPSGGEKAAPGAVVDVLVSRGATGTAAIAVPNTVGMSKDAAAAALTAAGLVPRTARAPLSAAATDTVAAQVPAAGTLAAKGAKVIVAVAEGRGPTGVLVPKLTGATSAAGQALLESVGLNYRSVSSPSASVPSGQLIAQLPAPGTLLPAGSPVLCVVSSGVPR